LSQVPVYGNNPYSFDSSICRAALHSGAMNLEGGEAKVEIVRLTEPLVSNFHN